MKTCILAIESSCDDTSVAVLVDGTVLSNVTANQEVHSQYGGVVPELASRAHQSNIVPTVEIALKKAMISKEEISAIAFTRGPGLLGSLIVGVSFAKALALSLDIPMIEVHHMHAHILAHFIEDPKPNFPFLCLTVSGGHTQITIVRSYNDMEIIGSTRDDAAGEAFDKAGKMMGLPYPAGPQIDRLAQVGKPIYSFTEPRIDGLDFSFSGLKTAILYFLRDNIKEDPNFIKENLSDICASIQERIVSILLNKLIKASEITGINAIAIAGGVSANSGLRNESIRIGKKLDWQVYIPQLQYCTDNAAMVAITGYFKYQDKDFCTQEVTPEARLTF